MGKIREYLKRRKEYVEPEPGQKEKLLIKLAEYLNNENEGKLLQTRKNGDKIYLGMDFHRLKSKDKKYEEIRVSDDMIGIPNLIGHDKDETIIMSKKVGLDTSAKDVLTIYEHFMNPKVGKGGKVGTGNDKKITRIITKTKDRV